MAYVVMVIAMAMAYKYIQDNYHINLEDNYNQVVFTFFWLKCSILWIATVISIGVFLSESNPMIFIGVWVLQFYAVKEALAFKRTEEYDSKLHQYDLYFKS
jgi:hypothetical protein